MTKEQEIAELEELIASPDVPEDEKAFARQELAELRVTPAPAPPPATPKPKTPPKARKPKSDDPCEEAEEERKEEAKESKEKYEAKSASTKVVGAGERLISGIVREAGDIKDKSKLDILAKSVAVITKELEKVKKVFGGKGLSKEEVAEFKKAEAEIRGLVKKFEDGGKVDGDIKLFIFSWDKATYGDIPAELMELSSRGIKDYFSDSKGFDDDAIGEVQKLSVGTRIELGDGFFVRRISLDEEGWNYPETK